MQHQHKHQHEHEHEDYHRTIEQPEDEDQGLSLVMQRGVMQET